MTTSLPNKRPVNTHCGIEQFAYLTAQFVPKWHSTNPITLHAKEVSNKVTPIIHHAITLNRDPSVISPTRTNPGSRIIVSNSHH